MSAIEKITISLPAEMIAELRAAIEAGEFTNVSEAVRDALRQWRRSRTVIALNDEELRRLVVEGRESGDPIDAEAVLRRLRDKYAAMMTEGR
jgi:antitoxin ParD1/3/4